MYKSHGKDYIENNFSPAELQALMKSAPSPPTIPTVVGLPTQKAGPLSSKTKHAVPQQPLPLLDFGCNMCGSKFLTRSKLIVHKQLTHGVIPIPCSTCGDKFESPIELAAHNATVHKKTIKRRKPGPASRTNAPPEKRGSNSIPNYLQLTQVSRRSSLAPVEEVKPEIKAEESSPDNSLADIVTKLASAAASKNVRADEKQTCNFCNFVSKNQIELTQHLINEHFKGLLPAPASAPATPAASEKCPSCPRAFMTKDQLETHIRSVHRAKEIRRTLGLDTSPTSYRRPGPKRARLSYTKDISEGTISAKATALRVLPSTAVLSASRIASLATKLRPVVLSSTSHVTTVLNCSTSATVPTVFESSQSSTILKPPPHIVNMMLGSTSNFILADHASSNPSPNPSELMDNNNNNNNNAENNNNNLTGLTDDELAQMKPRKKSECPVCGIVLSPKTNINVHLRTHSGVRPYECVLCLNRFRQKAHLMKHFRCTHNQKQPPHICLFCQIETATSNDLYRHITDQHAKDTDELRPSLLAARSDAAAAAKEAQIKEEQQQQLQAQQQEQQMTQQSVSEDEATPETYEPIAEDFMFEDMVISPCYVVLPYVSDEEVIAAGDNQLVSS